MPWHAACRAAGVPSRSATDPRRANAQRARRRAPESALPTATRALVLVDVLNPLDFDGAQPLQRSAPRMAARIAALKQRLAARGVPVVYVNDRPPSGPWRSDFVALLAHCRTRGGAAATLAERLAPEAGDHTLIKPRHSAFYGTPLQLLLVQWGVQEVVLCGLAADLCVQFSAMDAFERGFGLWVPSDCTESQTAARKRAALAWMERSLNARTEPSSRG